MSQLDELRHDTIASRWHLGVCPKYEHAPEIMEIEVDLVASSDGFVCGIVHHL